MMMMIIVMVTITLLLMISPLELVMVSCPGGGTLSNILKMVMRTMMIPTLSNMMTISDDFKCVADDDDDYD